MITYHARSEHARDAAKQELLCGALGHCCYTATSSNIMALILSNEEQLVAVVVLDRNKQIDKEIQLA